MIDKNYTPENKSEIEQSKLYDLAIILFGENGNQLINYSDSNTNITNELSGVYPDMSIYSNNYDSLLYGMSKNHSFVFMNFQIKDILLTKYLDSFKNQSFILKNNRYNKDASKIIKNKTYNKWFENYKEPVFLKEIKDEIDTKKINDLKDELEKKKIQSDAIINDLKKQLENQMKNI